jgi:hypothetical protein
MADTPRLACVALLILSSCMTSRSVQVRPLAGAPVMSAGEAFAEGKRQLEHGNIGLAVDSFRKAVRRSPESVEAMNGLAIAYDQLGRYDLSRRFYELALAAEPANPKVRHNLAVSLRLQGRNGEAIALEGMKTPEPIAIARMSQPLPEAEPVHVGVRLERLSTQEIALITIGGSRRGVEVMLDPPTKPIARVEPASRFPLLVLNAIGRRGEAAKARSYLAGVGWRQVAVGDSSRRLSRSVILFPRTLRGSAEKLSNSLPFKPRSVESPRVTRLVLLLGRNASGLENRSTRTPRS